ncbi:MAG: SNF2-related protein, partial [Bacilli bacterium]
MKKKKKYFRLKSGNIVNLEKDDSLKELENLIDDMDLSNKDIAKANGIMPKYRAIYLDSLRDNKYHIIKTNSLFNDLIDKFNRYKDINIDFTNEDIKILRDYQLSGIKWLYNVQKTGFGGILADEMGLGKSVQTIYFIKQLLNENIENKFLIIVPTSLAYNWEKEFIKFAPKLNYQVIVGNKIKRIELLNNLTNITITTYGLIREDFEYYKDINFKLCVIDEAQNIKNPNTVISKTVKQIKAESKFALTGTPLENSVT